MFASIYLSDRKHSALTLYFSVFLCGFLFSSAVFAQTSGFTYQGKLNDGGVPAGANYDMQFRLFDALSAGSQVGATQTKTNVPTVAGIFTVQLDFGAAAFDGADRFLEISISPAGQNNYVTLAPRQKITSAPYAIQSSKAATADVSNDSLNLGGIAANQYVQTNDTRLSDARTPLPGSSDYVQNNTVAPQPNVNFNIGGTGAANIFNAAAQYNLGGNRILSNAGTDNLFAGVGAGAVNTTGGGNSFFGRGSGAKNTTGSRNSFYGGLAGFDNTTGFNNSFFGTVAGGSNTTGSSNSFFGDSTGSRTTTGIGNSFVGASAGFNNTTGFQNTFFGFSTGLNMTTGNGNTFLGSFAGASNNSTGNQNTFVGSETGGGNITGSANTLVGYRANVGANNLSNATAVGAGAIVGTSNTVVLGRSADTVQIPGVLNAAGGFRTNGATGADIFGADVGDANISYISFRDSAGTQIGYVGDGSLGDKNTFLTSNVGSVELVTTAGRIFTATPTGNILMRGGPGVIGQTADFYAAQTIETANFKGLFTPNLFLSGLDTFLASPLHICARLQTIGQGTGGYALTRCTTAFSSVNYKSDVQPFTDGLNIIRRLAPVSFKWKSDGRAGVGLNVEDVAEVAPQIVNRSERGEIEDVSESGLTAVVVNAVKQQQEQIETQEKQIKAQGEQIKKQQAQIDALKKLVCAANPQADLCREEK